jgi:hypothetical protein
LGSPSLNSKSKTKIKKPSLTRMPEKSDVLERENKKNLRVSLNLFRGPPEW